MTTPPPKSVCVFCSSSDHVDPAYFEAAREVGSRLAINGHTLVYGGGNVGLMGEVARNVHKHGGRVVGVIPHALRQKELAYTAADELIVTRDMRERKAVMEKRADVFVALPGGFGTLEEVLEIVTLRQLKMVRKPVVFLNTGGFYDGLFSFFESLIDARFAKPASRALFESVPDVNRLFTVLENGWNRPTEEPQCPG